MSSLTATEHGIDAQSAATLTNALIDSKEGVHRDISFFLRSIGEKYEFMDAEDRKRAEHIRSWYAFQEGFTYHSPKWKISPERSLLFAKFRNDPNYPIKALVKNLGEREMPRVVLSIPPSVMAGFLSAYLDRVGASGRIEKSEILPLFRAYALGNTSNAVMETVHSQLDLILH